MAVRAIIKSAEIMNIILRRNYLVGAVFISGMTLVIGRDASRFKVQLDYPAVFYAYSVV